jgi:hypothetical protein
MANLAVAEAGLEPVAKLSAKTVADATGGAESGAVDPGLATVIDAWPLLSPHSRSIIVGMAQKAIEKSAADPRG